MLQQPDFNRHVSDPLVLTHAFVILAVRGGLSAMFVRGRGGEVKGGKLMQVAGFLENEAAFAGMGRERLLLVICGVLQT